MTTDLKRLASLILILITALFGLGAVAVGRNASVKQLLADRTLNQVLADYTDNTVLKTLALVVDGIQALDAAAIKLQAHPTDRHLAEAAAAWRAARARWKLTSAFMYGPAAHYNFDKQISSWPLDRPLVDHVVGEIAAGRLELNARYLREQLNASQRGFLAAEYLLFRDGQPRKAEDVGAAELSYLVAVTEVMTLESMDFEASWLGSEKLPADKASALDKAGIHPRKSYADEFKNPGQPGSRYVSPSVPLQEIFQDSVAVIEALCPVIEEALGSIDPDDSDTRYSHNALADVQHELQGVANAYLGGIEGARGHSVSELLAAKHAVLDRRIKIALAHTAHRITAVGDPYGESREDRELAVRIAVSACMKLGARLAVAMPLVSMDPSTRPWAAYGL